MRPKTNCMKQATLFFVLILGYSNLLIAQDRFSVSLAAGKSLSLRELATQITGSQRAQLAGDGLAAQIGAGVQFTRHLGLTVRLNYNENETREEGIKSYAAAAYDITNLTVARTEKWRAVSALAGPTLRVFLGTVSLQGRLMAGYASITGPAFLANGTFANRDVFIDSKTGVTQSFAFGAGSTFAVALGKHLSLAINADYTQTKAEFTGVQNIITVSGNVISPITPTITQDMGILNITAGLVVSF